MITDCEIKYLAKSYLEVRCDIQVSDNIHQNPGYDNIFPRLDVTEGNATELRFQSAAKEVYTRKVAYAWCITSWRFDVAASINSRRPLSAWIIAEFIKERYPDGASIRDIWHTARSLSFDRLAGPRARMIILILTREGAIK